MNNKEINIHYIFKTGALNFIAEKSLYVWRELKKIHLKKYYTFKVRTINLVKDQENLDTLF